MDQSEGNYPRRRARGEVCHRTWTTKEEEFLLEALKFAITEGFKSDNGFKCGYLRLVEGHMRKEFAGTDLWAKPYIKSRLTTWKKNYASLTTILNRSGVGFNLKGDFKVNCDEQEWDEIIKLDTNADKIYNKPWPLLDGWREVLGKDKATGDGAEDVMETLNEFLHEVNEEATDNATTDMPTQNDVNTATSRNRDKRKVREGDDPSVCNSSKIPHPSMNGKKKGKVDESSNNMCNVLGQIQRDMNTRFDSLITRIGYHVDIAQMRKEVYSLIREILGLSVTDGFTACDKIISKVERLEFFMALPEDDRASYVFYVLSSAE